MERKISAISPSLHSLRKQQAKQNKNSKTKNKTKKVKQKYVNTQTLCALIA